MSTFLTSKNNLADLTNLEKARKNLGIGTLAIQNSNEVDITGGKIHIDELIIKGFDQAEDLSFVVSMDNLGTLGFGKLVVRDWINDDQDTIHIGQFSNDIGYIVRDQICNVAFTGDYNDLNNIPTSIDELFDESVYLLKKNNLNDLENVDQAKSNLGFGPFASFDTSDNITISNLYVLNKFHFIPQLQEGEKFTDYENKYLQLKSYNEIDQSMSTEWVDFPVAGVDGNTYGLLRLSDDIESQDPYTAPTSKLMYETYSNLYQKIAVTTEQQFMLDLIDTYGLLVKDNNLSELTPVADEVRSNIGLGNISTQNIDDVNVENLTVTESLRFTNLPIVDRFLKCEGTSGEVIWSSLPNATSDIRGMVYSTSNMIDVEENRVTRTVLNMYGLSNLYKTIRDDIQSVSNNVPVRVRDLEDHEQILLISDAFANINAPVARANLKLKEICVTGSYNDLINAPTNLSDLPNGIFIDRRSNLSDLVDTQTARVNLGLGSMSTQDDDNVNIVGGIANISTLTVNNSLVFNNVPRGVGGNQSFYLSAQDNGGTVGWRSIPEATQEIYGVVLLTHDITVTETLHKAASATAVYQAYTRLNTMIDLLNRRVDSLIASLSS